MRIPTHRKKYLLIPLAIVILCTFGLFSAAFAAAPGSHGNGHGAAGQTTTGHNGAVSGQGTVHGRQNAMERIQRNVSRQIAHLEAVMGRVPDQAKSALEATVQRMQGHLQTLLAKLGGTNQNTAQNDQGATPGGPQATPQGASQDTTPQGTSTAAV